MSLKKCKVIIFDLDETLGYFTQLDVFVKCLEKYLNRELSNNEFFDILDIYSKFLRPNILNILHYLKNKKKLNYCDKIMLYTNNSGGKEWPYLIVSYFNYKLNCNLFDNVICSFKVKGEIIEPNRTSQRKKYNDVINCSKIPSNTNMFFLDDQYHEEMVHNNVYYINIKPYKYFYSNNDLINMYYQVFSSNINNYVDFSQSMNEYLNMYNLKKEDISIIEHSVDNLLSKKIMQELDYFFNKFKKTLKNRKHIKRSRKNKTVKK